MNDNEKAASKAGRPIPDFCDQIGLSRAAFYCIPGPLKPATVQIGRKVIVTESPAAWLERVRQAGGVKLQRPKSKTAAPTA